MSPLSIRRYFLNPDTRQQFLNRQLDASEYTDFGDDQVGVTARARAEHLKVVCQGP